MDHTFILTLNYTASKLPPLCHIHTFSRQRTENRARKTHAFVNVHSEVMIGWGGRGHVNVLCTSYDICCYAAGISGVVATVCTRRGGVGRGWSGMLTFLLLRTLDVAMLQRSLIWLLRCRDVWCCCYSVCTKGWGGGGHVNVPATQLRTLYVPTLQRCLVLLLRCVHEGVGWGWAC